MNKTALLIRKLFIIIITILCTLHLFSQSLPAENYVIDNESNGLIAATTSKTESTDILRNPGFRNKALKSGFQPVADSITLPALSIVPDSLFFTYKYAISLSLLEVFNGAVAMRFEWFIAKKHSLGIHASFYLFGHNPVTLGSEYDYYSRYLGVKTSPFYRFYPIRKRSFGLYLEGKVQFGYIYFTKLDYHYSNSLNPRVTTEETMHNIGWGVSVGISFGLPKTKHAIMNISAGYQYFPIDVPETIQYETEDGTILTLPTDTGWWYRGGPGTAFDLKITIGGIF